VVALPEALVPGPVAGPVPVEAAAPLTVRLGCALGRGLGCARGCGGCGCALRRLRLLPALLQDVDLPGAAGGGGSAALEWAGSGSSPYQALPHDVLGCPG
jgi:hypothetical protein